MSGAGPKGPRKTPKRLTPSIKKDGINPVLYNKLALPWSCDDCSHFDSLVERCSLGYNAANHRRAQLQKDYELSGKVALCRFQEID